MYKGISGSKGIGIGKAVIIEEKEIVIDEKTISDVDAEIARMKDAFEVFVKETNEMADNMEKTVGAKDADILRGHIMLLEDPPIKSQMEEMVSKDKVTAEKAVDEVFEQTAKIFEQIPDELLQQRAADFRDIKLRVIKILLGISHHDMATLPKGTVVIAKDLTPSMTAGIGPENIAGIITEIGGPTSHSAILARAMEIPAVLSVENIVSIASNDDKVILDGTTGEVFINPEDDVVLDYE